jgi:hypothetical protein
LDHWESPLGAGVRCVSWSRVGDVIASLVSLKGEGRIVLDRSFEVLGEGG